MQLSDLNSNDISLVSQAPAATPTGPLKLSDLHPDDVTLEPGGINQAKYGDLPGQFMTGLFAAERTAIPYLGEKFVEAQGFSPQEQKTMAETNPASDVAGTIGGFLTPIGGAIRVAEQGAARILAPAIGDRLAGIASTAIGGGAVGGIQALNDLALGDPNLTAQKALADVGQGFLLGGGLGVLGEAAKFTLPPAAKALSKSLGGLKETVMGTEEAPSAFARGLGAVGSKVAGDSAPDWAAAFNQGMSEGSVSAKEAINSLKDLAEKAKSTAADLVNRAGEADKPAAEAVETKFKQVYDPFMKRFRNISESKFSGDLAGVDPFTKEPINNMVNAAQEVSDAAENFQGFKAGEKGLSGAVDEQAAQNKDLKDLAGALYNRVKGSQSSFPGLGKIGTEAFIGHTLGLSNPVIGAIMGAVEAYRTLQNPFQMGKLFGAGFEKINALGSIVDSVTQKIEKLSKSALASSAREAAVLQMLPDRGYDKKVARLNELSNADQAMDHIAKQTAGLSEAAPNVSQSIASTMANGLQFLQSKVPRPSNTMTLSGDWEPSKTQKADFLRYVEAVENPLSTLKELKQGTLSGKHMEAMEAVHPQLLQAMRMQVLSELNGDKHIDLPSYRKVALAKFLGEPLDNGMTPQGIQASQMALQMPQIGNQQAAKQRKSTLGGLKQLNLANRQQTETQRVERNQE